MIQQLIKQQNALKEVETNSFVSIFHHPKPQWAIATCLSLIGLALGILLVVNVIHCCGKSMNNKSEIDNSESINVFYIDTES